MGTLSQLDCEWGSGHSWVASCWGSGHSWIASGDLVTAGLRVAGDLVTAGLPEWIWSQLDCESGPGLSWIASGDQVPAGLQVAGDLVTVGLQVAGDLVPAGLQVAGDLVTVGLQVAGDLVTVGFRVAGNQNLVTAGLRVGTWSQLDCEWGSGHSWIASWDLVTAGLRAAGDLFTAGLRVAGDLFTAGLRVVGDLVTAGLRAAGDLFTAGLRVVGDLFTAGLRVVGDLVTAGLRVGIWSQLDCELLAIYSQLDCEWGSGHSWIDSEATAEYDAAVSDHCLNSLCWACRMLPFARFMNVEELLQDIILSLVSELPPIRKVAEILVGAFPDAEDVRVPLRDKYHSLQQRLRHSTVRGKEIPANLTDWVERKEHISWRVGVPEEVTGRSRGGGIEEKDENLKIQSTNYYKSTATTDLST
ncbi:hypothetical protein scyTo_0022177 [Scyliorhinus torazame]|uniref:Uncharacterized protein n=1 Tax=Scyliorhinus torazame TaxID=75743 RepID=A0A401Q7X1_SCYTO|nr:hypothetical protein [Scyliorhinus torazame]